MHDTLRSSVIKGITRQIQKSRKPVTVLFTDIQDSTKYWDRHGDTQGRLMLDQHHRLVFPVITWFHGKILKTMGDGVMASFKVPDDAVRAAIGIQQLLAQQRERDTSSCPNVRIGIHTGTAIVEGKDIFGDVVNVASRLESHGTGGEILVSASTTEKLEQTAFDLVKKRSFTPKGKQRPLAVYRCRWKDHPNLIGAIPPRSFLPVIGRQKIEVVVHLIAILGISYLLYLKYVRHVIADSEALALLTLETQPILSIHPPVLVALIVAAAAVLVMVGAKTVPYFTLRLIKGGFGFCLAFLVFHLPATYLPLDAGPKWNETISRSRNLFVEVLADNTSAHQRPSAGSPIVRTVDAGALLLLADVRTQDGLTWTKVLIGKQRYGWVPRVLEAKIGEPEKRLLTPAYRFYFRYRDLYALLVGAAGFIWGFLNFRIRPA